MAIRTFSNDLPISLPVVVPAPNSDEKKAEDLIKVLMVTLAKLLEFLSSLTNRKNEVSISQTQINSQLIEDSKVRMEEHITKIKEYFEELRKQKEAESKMGPFKTFAKVLGAVVGALLGALTGGIAGIAVFTLIFVLTSPDVTGQGKSPLSLLSEQVGGPPWAQALFKVGVILALTLTASGVTTAATRAATNTATNAAGNVGRSMFSFNMTTAMTAVQLFSSLNPTVDIAVTGAQIAGTDEKEAKERAEWAHMAIALVLSILCLIKGMRSDTTAAISLGENGKKLLRATAMFNSLVETSLSGLNISQGVRDLGIAEIQKELTKLEGSIESARVSSKAFQSLQENSNKDTEETLKALTKILGDFAHLSEIWRAEAEGIAEATKS